MRHVCPALVLFGALISPLLADESGTIAGEVRCEQCNNFTGMYVEVSNTSAGFQAASQAEVSSNGHFEFRGIPYGNYTLTVFNANGVAMKRELAVVSGGFTNSVITLNTNKTQKPGTGTVSVARLKHKPVKAAVKAFNKAVEKTHKGDTQGAIALLEKAVKLDPDYMEAHNNLGARYLVSKQVERAIALFRKAIELDPGSASVYCNLSLALGSTGDLPGSEQAARKALSIDPGAPQGRYLLGISLFLQHKYNQETIAILRQAQDASPRAKVALAFAEAAVGDTVGARKTVKSYLQTSNNTLRPQAQELLSRLESAHPKQ
jgi:Flp pilus assembly protein TadD